MAIDIEELVAIDLAPVFLLDTTIEAAIPARIDAEMAIQGWILSDMDDQRSAYLATLVTKSFVPRLLLSFAQELKKVKGGPAETEFMDAIKFLKALQLELDDRITRAAIHANPTDALLEYPAWPGIGVTAW